VREGLLDVADFADVPLDADDLVASGLVSQAELLASGLIDMAGNVSLDDLIASGIVFLEELIGDDLVDETALEVSDVTLGDLLDTPLTDIAELAATGLVTVSDLLATRHRPARPDRVRNLLAGRPRGGRAARPARPRPARRSTSRTCSRNSPSAGPRRSTSATPTRPTSAFSGGSSERRPVHHHLARARRRRRGRRCRCRRRQRRSRGPALPQRRAGTFAFAATISDIAHLTTDVVLADMNGDGNLEPDRPRTSASRTCIYLGDGAGGFGAGTDISLETNLTSSNRRRRRQRRRRSGVVAGDSSFAVAGSASRFDVVDRQQGLIGRRPDVRSDLSVRVTADDEAQRCRPGGSDCGAATPRAIGLSARVPNIVRRMEAYVAGAVLAAQGSDFKAAAGPLRHSPLAVDDLLTYASAVGSRATSASPRLVSAADHGQRSRRLRRRRRQRDRAQPGTAQDLGVTSTPIHVTHSLGVAGTFVGSLQQGIGAAADLRSSTSASMRTSIEMRVSTSRTRSRSRRSRTRTRTRSSPA
jgi:hypothetical protein